MHISRFYCLTCQATLIRLYWWRTGTDATWCARLACSCCSALLSLFALRSKRVTSSGHKSALNLCAIIDHYNYFLIDCVFSDPFPLLIRCTVRLHFSVWLSFIYSWKNIKTIRMSDDKTNDVWCSDFFFSDPVLSRIKVGVAGTSTVPIVFCKNC